MRLLLDTHAVLWFYESDPKLSGHALSHITAPANTVYVSIASYWEIAIKSQLGKYQLHPSFDEYMRGAVAGNGFHTLAIDPHHVSLVANLPLHHRDPFDRMLVAQAIAEQMQLVSNDAALDAYAITRVW